METKEMKAVIAKKFSRPILVCALIIYVLLPTILLAIAIGTTVTSGTNDTTFAVVAIVLWFVMPIALGISILVARRRRQMTELTVNEKEIVGSYTKFIPITKISLRMPIEKIDNISAVNSIFFWYTGKLLRIASTSSVIKIPFVVNADEIVAFLSEAIEKAKNRLVKAVAEPEKPQGDAADSLKKLAELRNAGIITEEEFNQKKSELLGKM